MIRCKKNKNGVIFPVSMQLFYPDCQVINQCNNIPAYLPAITICDQFNPSNNDDNPTTVGAFSSAFSSAFN